MKVLWLDFNQRRFMRAIIPKRNGPSLRGKVIRSKYRLPLPEPTRLFPAEPTLASSKRAGCQVAP